MSRVTNFWGKNSRVVCSAPLSPQCQAFIAHNDNKRALCSLSPNKGSLPLPGRPKPAGSLSDRSPLLARRRWGPRCCPRSEASGPLRLWTTGCRRRLVPGKRHLDFIGRPVVVAQAVDRWHSVRASQVQNPAQTWLLRKCYRSILTRRLAITKERVIKWCLLLLFLSSFLLFRGCTSIKWFVPINQDREKIQQRRKRPN